MFPRRSGKKENLTPNIDRAAGAMDKDPLLSTRRRFLQNCGGVAIGYCVSSTVGNEVVNWSNETFRSHGTQMQVVGGANKKSPLLAVSFGGEGNVNNYYGATTIYSASGKKIPSADMIYDNTRGLNFTDMANILKESKEKRQFDYLVINGDSLGAMFGMYAALLADIPIAGFISNCGPKRLDDAVTSAVVTSRLVTSGLNPKNTIVGDAELAGKDLYCDVRDEGVWEFISDLFGNIGALPGQMAQGGSPQLQRSQLEWAEAIDFDQMVPIFKRRGTLAKGMTSAVFLEAANDNVIKPQTAYDDWKGWLGNNFGIGMPLLHMREGSVHADVFAGAACLQQHGYFTSLINQYDSGTGVQLI
jgi:hypothetical protein